MHMWSFCIQNAPECTNLHPFCKKFLREHAPGPSSPSTNFAPTALVSADLYIYIIHWTPLNWKARSAPGLLQNLSEATGSRVSSSRVIFKLLLGNRLNFWRVVTSMLLVLPPLIAIFMKRNEEAACWKNSNDLSCPVYPCRPICFVFCFVLFCFVLFCFCLFVCLFVFFCNWLAMWRLKGKWEANSWPTRIKPWSTLCVLGWKFLQWHLTDWDHARSRSRSSACQKETNSQVSLLARNSPFCRGNRRRTSMFGNWLKHAQLILYFRGRR